MRNRQRDHFVATEILQQLSALRHAEVTDVYCDTIQEVFEHHTGFFCTLMPGANALTPTLSNIIWRKHHGSIRHTARLFRVRQRSH